MPEGKAADRKVRRVAPGGGKTKVFFRRVMEVGRTSGRTVAITVDAKGRLALPKELRTDLKIGPGDVLFLRRRGRFLHLAKPENPFDVLAEDAIRQYRKGETVSLRKLAEAEGIDLTKRDDED